MSAPALTLYAIEDSIGAVYDTLEGLPDDELGMRAELEERLAHLVAAELRKVDGIAARTREESVCRRASRRIGTFLCKHGR